MARVIFYSSRDFPLCTTFIQALRSDQFLVNQELGALPFGLKWLRKSADHSFPSTAKNAWIGEWIDRRLFNNDVLAVIWSRKSRLQP
jgi:hypothetical protein